MSIPSDSSLPTENPNRISYSSPPPPPSNPIAQQTEDKSGLPIVRDAEQTRLPVIQTSSEDSERPPSAQRVKTDDDTETLDSSKDMEPDEEVGPAEKVADFDWHALHQRYHDAINKCQEDEASLTLEWQSLMNYFKVWAEAGHLQETERTYSRFRTRMAYVQHSEETLEKTRTHYVNVVTAFENALSLLRDQTFPG